MNPNEQQQAETKALTKTWTDEDTLSLGLPSSGAMNALKVFAKEVQGTPFFPKSLGTNPQTIFAVILTGREDGFSPMQAMRAYYLSPDGRLSLYADSMLAKMRRNLFTFEWHEATKEKCSITAKRKYANGDVEPYHSEFSIEDARTAGLLGKDNWKHYPQRMLKARVVSDIYRYLASDLGGAGMYSAEEIIDLQPDGTGEFSAAPQPGDAMNEPRSHYHVGKKPNGATEQATPAGPAPEPPVNATVVPIGTTASSGSVNETPAQVAHTSPAQQTVPLKPCGCVEGCLKEDDGKAPAGRFCKAEAEPPAVNQAPSGTVAGASELTAAGAEQASVASPVQDEAVPAETKKERKQRDPESEKIAEDLRALSDIYPKQAPRTAMSKFNAFFRAYSGTEKLPSDPMFYKPLIPIARRLASLESEQFWADPATYGRVEKQQAEALKAEFGEKRGYGAETLDLVSAIRAARNMTVSDVSKWFDALNLWICPEGDIKAFLRVALVTREAVRMHDLSQKYGISMNDIGGAMEKLMADPVPDGLGGKTWADLTEPEAIRMIDTIGGLLKQQFPDVDLSKSDDEQGDLPWLQ